MCSVSYARPATTYNRRRQHRLTDEVCRCLRPRSKRARGLPGGRGGARWAGCAGAPVPWRWRRSSTRPGTVVVAPSLTRRRRSRRRAPSAVPRVVRRACRRGVRDVPRPPAAARRDGSDGDPAYSCPTGASGSSSRRLARSLSCFRAAGAGPRRPARRGTISTPAHWRRRSSTPATAGGGCRGGGRFAVRGQVIDIATADELFGLCCQRHGRAPAVIDPSSQRSRMARTWSFPPLRLFAASRLAHELADPVRERRQLRGRPRRLEGATPGWWEGVLGWVNRTSGGGCLPISSSASPAVRRRWSVRLRRCGGHARLAGEQVAPPAPDAWLSGLRGCGVVRGPLDRAG